MDLEYFLTKKKKSRDYLGDICPKSAPIQRVSEEDLLTIIEMAKPLIESDFDINMIVKMVAAGLNSKAA